MPRTAAGNAALPVLSEYSIEVIQSLILLAELPNLKPCDALGLIIGDGVSIGCKSEITDSIIHNHEYQWRKFLSVDMKSRFAIIFKVLFSSISCDSWLPLFSLSY